MKNIFKFFNLKPNGQWLENRNAAVIFSLCVAAVIWLVVVLAVGSDAFQNTFTNVPIDIELQNDTFARLNLNPIEISEQFASATVVGDRLAVSSMNAEDLRATVQVSPNVNEPGSYSLRLVPANENYDRTLFKSIAYKPAAIQVKLDTLVSETFIVEPIINGLSMPPDFVRGIETVTPGEITVRGPKAEIEKIAKCVIHAELQDPLERTFVEDFPIKLLDAHGREIDQAASHLIMNAEQTRLVIEMLKITALQLQVRFTNIPDSFPMDELRYTMTADNVEVAAPVDTAGRHSDVILGHIDVRTINRENNSFVFKVPMPSGYQNLDGVEEVTVRFSNLNWEEAEFVVQGVELLNAPVGYKASIIGDSMYRVTLTGRKDVLAELTAEDIVLQIDLSERQVSVGQHQLPVKISVPNKGLVWAYGTDYGAVVQITANE